MDPNGGAADDLARDHASGVRDALRIVRRDVRGLSSPEVMDRLTRALAERGVFYPPSDIEMLCRSLARRWWERLTPFKTLKDLRAAPNPGIDDSWNARQQQLMREDESAMRRLDRVISGPGGPMECSVSASVSATGLRQYTVLIDPYDDHTVQRIREALAPAPVTVGPTAA